MMEEEFQESEIIFFDHQHSHNYREMASHMSSQFVRSNDNSNSNTQKLSRRKKKKKMMKNSAPVNIPETIFQFPDSDEFEEEDDDGDDDGEFVPPHLIMSRRIAGKMAFSVCTGNGRTLKGRDLSHVRNSILKLTGFLET